MRLGFRLTKFRGVPKAEDALEWEDILTSGQKFLEGGGKLPEDTVKADDVAVIMYTGELPETPRES